MHWLHHRCYIDKHNTMCAVSLANHLMAVVDMFRSLRTHQRYWTTEMWTLQKWSTSNIQANKILPTSTSFFFNCNSYSNNNMFFFIALQNLLVQAVNEMKQLMKQLTKIEIFLTASPTLGLKHNKDGLAIKLNWLKEKSARYVSHKDLLSECIKSKIFWRGLPLPFELTIGNFDQGLLNGTPVWKGFLLH